MSRAEIIGDNRTGLRKKIMSRLHAFLELAQAEPKRYLVLDATLPADDLAAMVAARINDLLPPEPVASDDGLDNASGPPNFRSVKPRAEAEVG